MINIDKNDELYRYLLGLGVDDIDEAYKELASAGRYKRKDVQLFLRSTFEPSQTEDILEEDLQLILDYYVDLKNIKPITSKKLNSLLKEYEETKNKDILSQIISSQLKDVLHMCINYKTLHKEINLQDLIQEANFGIIKAIEKYKHSAKIGFKDYLTYYLRETIIKNFKEKENG